MPIACRRRTSFGPDGAWGRWLEFLYRRYARYGENVALELANEPNIQWWPQRDPTPGDDRFAQGRLISARAAADMTVTAQEIADRHGDRLLIAGPGTWDGPKGDPAVIRDSRLYTDYATFTEALLGELERRDFTAGPRFVWTQHNYNDTLYRHGLPGAPRNRAAHARELLAGRWQRLRRLGQARGLADRRRRRPALQARERRPRGPGQARARELGPDG